jgi:hypothetical protein
MKVQIIEVEKKFEPIEVKLVFDTIHEVVNFISLVKDPECFSGTIAALDSLANELRSKINKVPSEP